MSEDKAEAKQPEAEEKSPKPKKSVLERLKNNILMLVAIMGALVTLISQIPKMIEGIDKSFAAGAGYFSSECINIEAEKMTSLPHYLIPSVGGSEDFPYWLRLKGSNSCKDVVSLVISFKGGKNVAEIDSADMKKNFTITKDKLIDRAFYPKLTLSNTEPKTIGLSWKIERGADGKGKMLGQDTIQTKITEPHTIDWDLKKPSGTAVDPKYLYASLAAWVRKPPKEVMKRTKDCRSNKYYSDAIKHCYEYLFSSDKAFSVLPNLIHFPKKPQQFIRPLSDVIVGENPSISSLEAGLLISAVLGANSRRKPDLFHETGILITRREGKSIRQKDVYLVWDDHSKWQGINMQLASQKSFDENKSATEAMLANLFSADKARKAIEDGGVFINESKSLVLVNFRTAARKHGIQPLRKIVRTD